MLSIVPDFARSLLQSVKAPSGRVSTFIEVPFVLNKHEARPDGVIRVERGSRKWTALVEVKTGRNELSAEQIERYLDIAREQGFDSVITISNQVQTMPGNHPTTVDKRKLRKVTLFHWSWSYLLSMAIFEKEHHGVSDPEQAWILGELIRYLEHDRSGAMEFEDMGSDWVKIRDAITAGTLRPGDEGSSEVAAYFQALLRYISLRLGRRLGTEVTQVLSRAARENPTVYTQQLATTLAQEGRIGGSLRVPDAVGEVRVETDLRSRQITCSIDVSAPQEGRPTTRVNWLLRQLKTSREDLRIESFVLRGRGASAAELLRDAREDPSTLVQDREREIKSFRVALTVPMGIKRGRGAGTYVDSVIETVDVFYTEVVQRLKEWQPRLPELREPRPLQSDPLDSTDISSQDF
ncbi:hypothetical protein KAE78_13065 [Microbacterium sp. NIBRBAC000506063]|nr:hypothetical protein KAE78_13065 [Microbacterium sp. NIBRBAC000506063]